MNQEAQLSIQSVSAGLTSQGLTSPLLDSTQVSIQVKRHTQAINLNKHLFHQAFCPLSYDIDVKVTPLAMSLSLSQFSLLTCLFSLDP